MDAIENAAYVSIGRACGFAGLGIFCVMFGLSFDPPYAARVGGILCLGIAAILYARGWSAPTRPYKKTELWIIIDRDKRPPAAIAQKVIGTALRDAYLWFAQSAATIALVLLISALVLHFTWDGAPLFRAGAQLGGQQQSGNSPDINTILLLPSGPGFKELATP